MQHVVTSVKINDDSSGQLIFVVFACFLSERFIKFIKVVIRHAIELVMVINEVRKNFNSFEKTADFFKLLEVTS